MVAAEMVKLPAELTHDTPVPQLLEQLVAASPQQGGVAVDASGLTRLDSSCVALLLEWQRRLGGRGQSLTVHGAPSTLVELLQVYGAQELIQIA